MNRATLLRASALAGLIFAIFSLFMEWYIVDYPSLGLTNVYYLLEEWNYLLVIIFLGLLIISFYVVVFKEPQNTSHPERLKILAFLTNCFLVLQIIILVLYYYFSIIQRGLFFPFLKGPGDTIQTVGSGFFLMCLSFGLTFPYFRHIFILATSFKKQSNQDNSNSRQDEVSFGKDLSKTLSEDFDLNMLIEIQKSKLQNLSRKPYRKIKKREVQIHV